MIIYVDIDDTICYYLTGNIGNYKLAHPWPEKIETINRLYDAGHTIIYWTARGTVTGIDWSEHTTIQLHKWGCRYHKLIFGKPNYDLFIDDKTLTSIDQLNLGLRLTKKKEYL